MPTIHLPGHVALTTKLSAQQITDNFPNLHKYDLPSNPDTAVLPKGSVTYHGLETVIRWTEYRLSHPDMGYELDLITSVEMYHALHFLGRKSTDLQMRYIHKLVEAAILDGIELHEVAALWNLKEYTGAAPFVRCLVRYIERLVQKIETYFQQPAKKPSMSDGSQVPSEIGDLVAAMDVLTWAEGIEELWNRIHALHALRAKQGSNLRNLRKYGYVKRKGKGVHWIAKSAVQCAKMKTGLETIEEDDV